MEKKNRKAHHHATKIMGCAFVITAVHEDPQLAWASIRAAEKEMRRIENLISSWNSNTQTSQINEAAGKRAVQVEAELFALIERSIKVSQLTCGAFDISGTLSRYYWNFDCTDNTMLSDSQVEEMRSRINYQWIQLDPSARTVFLKRKGMKIGFGGIGKGYAANQAKKIMQSMDVHSGLINASGDLVCWGKPPQQNQWNVKVPDPRDRTNNLLNISIDYGSVVTSGSYENYTMIEGQRYSHIINPRTCMPVTHTKNVTVICPDAEFGDAIATGLSVLPIDEGLQLANALIGVECIIIDHQDQAHYSNTLKQYSYA